MSEEIFHGGSNDLPVGDLHAEWLQQVHTKLRLQHEGESAIAIHMGDIHGDAVRDCEEDGDESGAKFHKAARAEWLKKANFHDTCSKAFAVEGLMKLTDIRRDGIRPDRVSVIAIPRNGQRELGKAAVAEGLEHIIGTDEI